MEISIELYQQVLSLSQIIVDADYDHDADSCQKSYDAIAKICENPFRNHRRFSIRYLKGKWDGYLEYRSNTQPIFRVIYHISDEDSQQIEVCEKLRHL